MDKIMNEKLKLFIVDDEEVIRRLLDDIFSDDYIVTCLESASQTLKELEIQTPDIILTDNKMPGEDGLTLAKKISEMNTEIPIILLTGHGNKQVAIDAVKLGLFDFVEKPFEDDEIKIAIDRAAQFSILMKNNRENVKKLQNAALELLKATKRENKLASEVSWLKKLL